MYSWLKPKMAKRQRPTLNYAADLVWAAACTAYRVNRGYLKYPQIVDGKIVSPANRELVRQYLDDSGHGAITAADLAQGRVCRQTLANSATMQALQGRLSEWNLLSHQMAELDIITSDYEVSVITAMPKSYDQTVLRENTNSRLAHCDDMPIGCVNERVTLLGEIVRCNYSNKFNTHYVTVITNANQQVFFAYRESLKVGDSIQFCGRVKRHADRATQLSRVKILEQEAV
jgi:flagella basal body P-ring formation protein FlgA